MSMPALFKVAFRFRRSGRRCSSCRDRISSSRSAGGSCWLVSALNARPAALLDEWLHRIRKNSLRTTRLIRSAVRSVRRQPDCP